MSDKRVALDLAAFLDSPEARALAAPRPEDVRRIAEIFLTACYDGIGKAPYLIDGEDMHALLGHLMPGRFGVGDPLAAHVPTVVATYLDHLETVRTVAQTFEIRRGLEATADEFLEAVRTGRDAHHAQPRQDPFVHGAPKTGRNDPCFCGSGKKFKKCHGKEGA